VACLATGACQQPRGRVPEPAADGVTTAVPPAKPTLLELLNRELTTFKADTGVFVKHLMTGEEAGVRDDRAFNSFSVIKLAIMVRAFDLSDHGRLNLDERVLVRESDLRGGSGILYTFDAGLRVTIRDLLTEMIITSDNSATDMLLARVGGLDALNGWLRGKGFTETRMVQSTADFFRQPLVFADPKYRSLSSEQVYAYWNTPYEINAVRSRRRAAMAAELQKAVPLGPQIVKLAPLWSVNPQ
jgi:beta-lactamase class A